MENIKNVNGVRVGMCDCGARVYLSDSWENECGRCGQLYNAFGQAIQGGSSQWSSWELAMGLDN